MGRKVTYGYLVGYKPYSTGYLVWYPGACFIDKARDIIFHEDAITPAIPTVYGDNDMPRNISEAPDIRPISHIPLKPPAMHSAPSVPQRLFICIPACLTRIEYDPEDQGHATIEEVTPDQPQQE
jgi:hypothetical protein